MEQAPFNNEKQEDFEVLARESLESLKQSIQVVLEKIKENIHKGEYGAIVGIDGSGRVPALWVHDVVQKIDQDHGREKTPLFFVPGFSSYEYLQEEDDELHKEMRQETISDKWKVTKERMQKNNQKVLFIDDVIESGDTLTSLQERLEREGLSGEAAVLFGELPALLFDGSHTTPSADEYEKATNDRYDFPIFVGSVGAHDWRQYSKKVSGVKKLPHAAKKDLMAMAVRKMLPEYVQESYESISQDS